MHYYIECEITYKISDDKEVKQKQSNTSSNSSSSSKYYIIHAIMCNIAKHTFLHNVRSFIKDLSSATSVALRS